MWAASLDRVSDASPVTLADRAYAELRGQILSCALQPGSLVTERALARDTGLGQAAIRNALTRLASEALVEAVPRVGYRVAPITLQSVNDFFEAWEILGPAVLDLAVRRMSSTDRALIEALDVPGQYATLQELIEYATVSWDIIVRAAGNRVLADLYRRLASDIYRIFTLVWRSGAVSPREALGMTRVVASRPDEAESMAREYIQAARERVVALLTTEATPGE